jgi:precorrin-6A/cobalt-precorrin-6A reductase
MILLLGGTTETPQIANLLAEDNCKVLVSNLTKSMVDWNLKSNIRIRQGRLDINSMEALIVKERITAIVDAGHPYAEKLHKTAIEAALKSNILYYRYERPGFDFSGYDVEFADSHDQAAQIAFRLDQNVLITTGTRNLEPYVKISRTKNANLYMRVLPCQESMDICKKHSIDNDYIIVKRGPFTTKQNIDLINKYSIDVLVTKDSGIAGGVLEKLKAAKACGTKVIVIRKPAATQKPEMTFEDISELIRALSNLIKKTVAD